MSIESQLRMIIQNKMRGAASKILPQVNQQLAKSYENEAFVKSLRGGLLAADFGLTPSRADSATAAIIKELQANTRSHFKLGSGATLATLEVSLQTGVSQGVIDEAAYFSGDHRIDWLDFLLHRCLEVIITDFNLETLKNKGLGEFDNIYISKDTDLSVFMSP